MKHIGKNNVWIVIDKKSYLLNILNFTILSVKLKRVCNVKKKYKVNNKCVMIVLKCKKQFAI